jgi:hypothetical protein
LILPLIHSSAPFTGFKKLFFLCRFYAVLNIFVTVKYKVK